MPAGSILVADDDTAIRTVLNQALSRAGYEVRLTGNAATLWRWIADGDGDLVITDVIMPDKDGYTVCSEIKQHPDYSDIPVVLMSGVVNKTVADKAVAVHADELIRKPFQPQELILRVKTLLQPKGAEPVGPEKTPAPSIALNQLFAPTPAPSQPRQPLPLAPANPPSGAESAWPRALADAFIPRPVANGVPAPSLQSPAHQRDSAPRPATPSADIQKLRAEITFLDSLVKKLQAELQNERQYNQSLEKQIRSLTSE